MTDTTRIHPSDAEIVLDAHSLHGEGPLWHLAEGVLYWVNIMACEVRRYDPATGRDDAFQVGAPVGAAAPRASGRLVLALDRGFAALDTRTGRVEPIAEVEGVPASIRMNDGKCDSAGRFWAGTMAYESTPRAGALYRLDPDHHITGMLDGVTISNGLCWSGDDRTMYYIDSGTGGVDAFDYDATAGTISKRRRIVAVPPENGVPDGMTIDAEGFLWVALWGGWAVHRYAPDGRLDRVVRLPVSHVSCCTFGGPDLSDLYITSATSELSALQLRDEPHAGALFRCRPGVTGLPAQSYRG